MSISAGALLLWTAMTGPSADLNFFDEYRPAYEAGRARNAPVLVILNPGSASHAGSIDVDAIRRAAHRRELLAHYAVAVIDTSTPAGETVYRSFKSPALPAVSVLDRDQKWQLYKSSRTLTLEDWNLLLEKYQSGVRPPVAASPANCFT